MVKDSESCSVSVNLPVSGASAMYKQGESAHTTKCCAEAPSRDYHEIQGARWLAGNLIILSVMG